MSIINPLPFLDALIQLAKTTRALERILADMRKLSPCVELDGFGDTWECCFQVNDYLFRGQAADPRGAVLDCPVKAHQGLSEQGSGGAEVQG